MKYYDLQAREFKRPIINLGSLGISLFELDLEGVSLPANRGPLDLDGLKKVQDYSKKVIDEQGRGIFLPTVALITGRPAPYAELAIQAIGALDTPGTLKENEIFCVPSIVENGAVFYDHNTRSIVGYHPEVVRNQGGLRELQELINSFKSNPYFKEYIRCIEPGKAVCISLNPDNGFTTEFLHKRLIDYMQEREQGLLKLVDIGHSESAVDITPKGVSKRSALEHMCTINGIDLRTVVGVGDSKGDREWLQMLKNSGGIVAVPHNGISALGDIADYKSDLDEAEGLADIFYHYVLRHL